MARSLLAFPSGSVVKNPPAVQEIRVCSLGGEDPLEEGIGNPLQYSCLENLMDRGVWQAIIHRITQSWTQLKWLSMHTHPCCCLKNKQILSDIMCKTALTSPSPDVTTEGSSVCFIANVLLCIYTHIQGTNMSISHLLLFPMSSMSWTGNRVRQTCSGHAAHGEKQEVRDAHIGTLNMCVNTE